MDREDEDEARNYKNDLWKAGKSLEAQAIEFLRSKGWITDEEVAAARKAEQVYPHHENKLPLVCIDTYVTHLLSCCTHRHVYYSSIDILRRRRYWKEQHHEVLH